MKPFKPLRATKGHEEEHARAAHATAWWLLVCFVVAFVSGCGNAASVVRELGNEHSAVSVTIVTPWGTQHAVRVNPTTQQSATVGPDGTVRIESK